MRPLFADAPVTQPAPVMGGQPASSPLAAALSHPASMPVGGGFQAPQIPLSSLMQAMQGPQQDPNKQGGVIGYNGYQGQQAQQPNWLQQIWAGKQDPNQIAPGMGNPTLDSAIRGMGGYGGITGGAPT
jgi:hypothetical protein